MLLKTIAPFHDLHMGRDTSFQLAPDAHLAPMPDWLKDDPFMRIHLSQTEQDELKRCTHCFLSEYEAAEIAEPSPSRMEEQTRRSSNSPWQ